MHSVKTGLEASKMLEAALQQMDGIISNTSSSGGGGGQPTAALTLNERNLISANNVISTAKTLALALQQVGVAAPAPDPVTAAIIGDWLETHIPRQDSDERQRRLQRDKESLALQYQILAERVSEQADKILELEGLLTEKTQQLCTKEDQLQRQMISSSALETQKLELMTALSELKLHRVALERENSEFQTDSANNSNISRDLPPLPFGSVGNLSQRNSPFSAGHHFSTPKTPPAMSRHQIKPQFHSLPRSHGAAVKQTNKTKAVNHNNNNNNAALDANANANTNSPKQRNVAFASNEKIIIDDENFVMNSNANNSDAMSTSYISQTNSTPSPNLRERSTKGIRGIFGKLRRCNSGNLECPGLEEAEPEFRRGGARATVGGRIEWSTPTSQLSNVSKDYKDWSPQEVCNWLIDLGLGCYEENCRKWLKANPSISFFNVSPIDIDKELNLKLPLHRKKIVLAIDELTGKEKDELALKAAELDTSWVLRWLDDIGLPQYKDHFLQSKVDGRMLHRLTLEDLPSLHMHSCLHIASLRCGIKCMREVAWNSECLIRRSINPKTSPKRNPQLNEDDEPNQDDTDENSGTKECISLWTTHRVMEWLRVADLSEYAPNLRGAGVHGALMLFEKRFNAALLADLLSIPPSKSLLRRHLATHFKELLGREVIQDKREAEAAPGYIPLTTTAKVKPPKKTNFSLKRRKSSKGPTDSEWTGYLCPMSTSTSTTAALDVSATHSPKQQHSPSKSPSLSSRNDSSST